MGGLLMQDHAGMRFKSAQIAARILDVLRQMVKNCADTNEGYLEMFPVAVRNHWRTDLFPSIVLRNFQNLLTSWNKANRKEKPMAEQSARWDFYRNNGVTIHGEPVTHRFAAHTSKKSYEYGKNIPCIRTNYAAYVVVPVGDYWADCMAFDKSDIFTNRVENVLNCAELMVIRYLRWSILLQRIARD